MLYFRDYHWLCDVGRTRFSAHIEPEHCAPDDVRWSLDFSYVAGGSTWRRVQEWVRPAFDLSITGFQLPGPAWRDLARVNFWNPAGTRRRSVFEGGFVCAHLRTRQPGDADSDSIGVACHWHVIEHADRFFTVELASFADGRDPFEHLEAQPVAVLADGTEQRADPDAEFWKANAQLYLIERVPFGTVTVEVPRNARDPEGYAVARAQALVGGGQPQHLELHDHKDCENPTSDIRGNLYVHVHFHGFYDR